MARAAIGAPPGAAYDRGRDEKQETVMSIKLIFASSAALALIAGTPANAAKSQSEQAKAGSGAKAKDERKICKTFDNSESRMKRERLCLTRAQWKKFDEVR
ncbi:MAG TPA: hypothetical protein VFZ91_10630 [Allosphingosinicella sp.]